MITGKNSSDLSKDQQCVYCYVKNQIYATVINRRYLAKSYEIIEVNRRIYLFEEKPAIKIRGGVIWCFEGFRFQGEGARSYQKRREEYRERERDRESEKGR